jgi:hypothetical protein
VTRFDFATWNLTFWCLFAAIGFTLEFIGIFHGKQDATLTYLIRNSVPAWARAMVLGWLCYHFMIQK